MDSTTYNQPGCADRRFRFKRGIRGAISLFTIGCLLSTLAATAAPRFVPGQILIKLKAGISETNLVQKLRSRGPTQRRSLHRLNLQVVNVPEEDVEALLAALRQDPTVEFAERDYLAETTFEADDPYVLSGDEWHLSKLQTSLAWNITAGSANGLVGILDSGINASQPDLAGQVVSAGYNFVSGDTNVADDFGHGTAVSGTVAALGGNGIGVAGVAFNCRVLPVKVVDSSGYAAYSALAQGIHYAVDAGVRVINISIAGSSASSTLQEAVDYAWSRNVVIVASAGNNANSTPQYPAACTHVVAVSATIADDSLAAFSSYGGYVSLAAPGDGIWTTQRDPANPYGAWRGTSFSSPIVAGVAALVISENPSLSNDEVVSVLEQSADDLGPAGFDPAFGFGRVNALRAVSVASALPGALPPSPPTNRPAIFVSSNTAPIFAVLRVATNGFGTVKPNLDGRLLEIGKGYAIKAVPGAGQIFAGWSGVASESSVLHFEMQKDLALVANFVTNPFPRVKGSYAGLLADTNGVRPDSSGYFKLTVTRWGRFTGKLRSAGTRHGFHGRFDAAGDATVTVRRGRLAPVTLVLHVDLTNGTGAVTGQVTDGGWVAELWANRKGFGAKRDPAPQAGRRAFVLERADDPALLAANGSSRISHGGAARVKGRLVDGRAFSAASVLAKDGDYPFYVSFRHGAEVVVGWLNFPAVPEPTASGTVVWVCSGTNSFSATLQADSVR